MSYPVSTQPSRNLDAKRVTLYFQVRRNFGSHQTSRATAAAEAVGGFRRLTRSSGDPPGCPPTESGLPPPEARFAAHKTCRRPSASCRPLIVGVVVVAQGHQHIRIDRVKSNQNGRFLQVGNQGSRTGKTQHMRPRTISQQVGIFREATLLGGRGEPLKSEHAAGRLWYCAHKTRTGTLFKHSQQPRNTVASGTAHAGQVSHLRPRLVESGIADAVEPVREAGYPSLVPVAQQPRPARIDEHKVEAGVPPSLLFSSEDHGSISHVGRG